MTDDIITLNRKQARLAFEALSAWAAECSLISTQVEDPDRREYWSKRSQAAGLLADLVYRSITAYDDRLVQDFPKAHRSSA